MDLKSLQKFGAREAGKQVGAIGDLQRACPVHMRYSHPAPNLHYPGRQHYHYLSPPKCHSQDTLTMGVLLIQDHLKVRFNDLHHILSSGMYITTFSVQKTKLAFTGTGK